VDLFHCDLSKKIMESPCEQEVTEVDIKSNLVVLTFVEGRQERFIVATKLSRIVWICLRQKFSDWLGPFLHLDKKV